MRMRNDSARLFRRRSAAEPAAAPIPPVRTECRTVLALSQLDFLAALGRTEAEGDESPDDPTSRPGDGRDGDGADRGKETLPAP